MRERAVRTHQRAEMLDITAEVSQAVRDSGIKSGWVTVFVPHTTAGITINENADPDVVADVLAGLERIVPKDGSYLHSEGNADAHIKSSLVGPSITMFVENGRLALGIWQAIYFCEFDGPRNRHFYISVLSDKGE